MASNCIDKNDQTTINRLNLGLAPTTNSNGEYTLDQVEVFAKEFAESISADALTNPILIAQSKYGDTFFESLDFLNGSLLKGRDLTPYPSLRNRLSQGSITPLELTDFQTLFNHTPSGLILKGNRKSLSVLFELERYYSNDIKFGALGGVCALFETVFAAVDGFFNFIGEVGALVVEAYAFLQKIKDPIKFIQDLGIAAAVEALINQIKDLIIQTVKDIFAVIEQMIENFNIAEIMKNIDERIDNATIKRVMKAKDESCLFLSEENQDTVLKKIQGLFDYAVGLFENPGLKEIEYLITRFCAFLSNLNALILDVKSPMDQFEFKYTRVANRLKTISNLTTSTAIRSGAIRFSEEAKLENINKINTNWQGTGDTYYTPTGEESNNVKKPSIQEYSDLPSCKQVKDGSTKKIEVSGNWVTDFGMEGWTGLDYDLRVYLMRFNKKADVKLILKRGWISQQYNARIGGSPNSVYMSGKAVSISVTNFKLGQDDETIIRLAKESGFKFAKIDTRQQLLHLDIRPLSIG